MTDRYQHWRDNLAGIAKYGEEWLPADGQNGLYWISSSGRVWSAKSGRLLRCMVNSKGYHHVRFSKRGAAHKVHRLVCLHFNGLPPPGCPNALHKDDDRDNNDRRNLYWGSQKSNAADCQKNGKAVILRGESNRGGGKLSAALIPIIRSDPRRQIKIAAEHGISQVMVSRIKLRKSWSHIE